MADASTGSYDVEGHKISLKALGDFASLLPLDASVIVGQTHEIVTTLRDVPSNRDEGPLFRTSLLKCVLVVLSALCEQIIGDEDPPTVPTDLQQNVSRFIKTLDDVRKKLSRTQSVATMPQKRRKVKEFFIATSQTTLLQGCRQGIQETATPFSVESNFLYAVCLCQIPRTRFNPIFDELLEKLPRADYARFDSERPDQPSSCFKGTRVAIIKEIIRWIVNPNVERFFWLDGLAGIGKTTIAYTIAKFARSLGILGASFLFSRGGKASLRDPALVFPTIAYQLARFDPEFSQRISAALKADPEAPTAPLRQQCNRLIIEPLSGLERDTDRVVIVVFDAFDECEAVGAKTILRLLIDAMPRLPFFLKIFLTSRPEKHIRSVLAPRNNHLPDLRVVVLHNIDAGIVKNDIRLYLHARLRSLPDEKEADLSADWITNDEVEILVDAADTLFIYAETVLRFLSDAYNLRDQFEVLLQIITSFHVSSDGTAVFLSLDELYTEVLRATITPRNRSEALRLLQSVLGAIVILRDPLPVDSLERLAGLRKNEAVNILNSLHSVILPPSPPDNCPRIYHPSFSDFLQDPNRCTDKELQIDGTHEQNMALQCLKLIKAKLHKGMLEGVDPSLFNDEVEDLEDRIKAAISWEVRYACRHWPSHLSASALGNTELVTCLEEFASSVRLPWMEVMSWLQEVRAAQKCLEAAIIWATDSSCALKTLDLLQDGRRLLVVHFQTIANNAQQIARSVLPFAPRNIRLTSEYEGYADASLRVIRGRDEEWRSRLTWWQCGSTGWTMVVSPDGSLLGASGGDNVTKVWNAEVGILVCELDCWAKELAFSPSGSHLASGCYDGTIYVWDIATQSCQSHLCEGNEPITSIVYSLDGLFLASGSYDGAIRVWSATGVLLRRLNNSGKQITSLAYSPDGAHLASGADGTVKIWDPTTGVEITTFHIDTHPSGVINVIYSPNGSRLATLTKFGPVQLWDSTTLPYKHITTIAHLLNFNTMAFSPDCSRLATGCTDRCARIWNLATTSCIAALNPPSGVDCIAFISNGSQLITGAAEGNVSVWEISIGDGVQEADRNGMPVSCLTFSPNGLYLASSDSFGYVYVWNAASGDPVVTSCRKEFDELAYLAFSADGSRVISRTLGNVSVWDIREGDLIKRRLGTDDEVAAGGRSQDTPFVFDESRRELRRLDGDRVTSDLICLIPATWDLAFVPKKRAEDEDEDTKSEDTGGGKEAEEGGYGSVEGVVSVVAASVCLPGGGERIALGCEHGRVMILELNDAL